MMTNTKRYTADELHQMVGCSVSYLGHEATIVSCRPDMGTVRLIWPGGTAIVRPSEIR